MRLFPLLALLTLSPLAAQIQTQPAPGQRTSIDPKLKGAVVLQATSAQGCPVGLEARHAQDGGLISVSPSGKHPGQSYRLTFVPGPGRSIAQAEITLHGLAGGRLIPAGRNSESSENSENFRADATESFTIAPSLGPKHLFHSTVHTEKLTGVQWLELNELTYTDGTTWHESATATCHVAPNGYMLVAATN